MEKISPDSGLDPDSLLQIVQRSLCSEDGAPPGGASNYSGLDPDSLQQIVERRLCSDEGGEPQGGASNLNSDKAVKTERKTPSSDKERAPCTTEEPPNIEDDLILCKCEMPTGRSATKTVSTAPTTSHGTRKDKKTISPKEAEITMGSSQKKKLVFSRGDETRDPELGGAPRLHRNSQVQPPEDSMEPGAYAIANPRARHDNTLRQVNEVDPEQPLPHTNSVSHDHETGLTEAIPVEERDQPLQQAVEELEPTSTHTSNENNHHKRRLQKINCLLGVGLLLVVTITLLLVFLLAEDANTREEKTHQPASPPSTPTMAPTQLTPEDFLISFLPAETINTIQEQPQSPQSKAFQWLAEDPSVMDYSKDRIYQKFSLAVLYHSTGGPNWLNNQDWLSYDVHECNWYTGDTYAVEYAVEGFDSQDPSLFLGDVETYGQEQSLASCNANNTLQHLWLNANLLDGTIPPELCWLTHIKSLSLGVNEGLRGTIPPQIGMLTELEALGLVGIGNVGGSIPSQIGLLSSNLLELELVANVTGSVPSQLGQLSKLEVLSLDLNSLTGHLPSQLGLLTNLIYLECDYNRLTGPLPSELGLLSSLRLLFSVANLHSGQIPSQLGMARRLQGIDLGENFHLSGTIPTQLGRLTNINTVFSLFDNSLGGTIPTEMGALTKTSWYWSVTWNQLTGTVPSELGLLSHLGLGLFVFSNFLTGTIPTELGQFQYATVGVSVADNLLTGTIPSELGKLTSLMNFGYQQFIGLSVDRNNLTGTVPSELGNVANVECMSLGYNEYLGGTLPTELGLLSGVSKLGVEYTQIGGTLSSWLGSLTTMQQLRLQHTLLSGSIPEEIVMLANHSLLDLNITGSLLTGLVARELCDIAIFECTTDGVCGCNCSCS